MWSVQWTLWSPVAECLHHLHLTIPPRGYLNLLKDENIIIYYYQLVKVNI